ncbi:MAG: pimeloyl-ACP methyl ester carboxylesterase [Deltaproteobacteria bacterium]|nr:pimeloyl-ACP methyl ester carboxylesterase [Deltaproteobacteria bacterium]
MPGDGTGSAVGIPGGMRLGVAEYGRPGGRPILYFHGLSGSRLEASLADRAADDLGVRLIALDRPGMGLSDFRPDRKIPDIVSDTERLADALGLGRFAVLGVSAGAPYALACGIRLAGRVTCVGLVSSAGPFSEKRYRASMGWITKAALRAALIAPGLAGRLLRGVMRGILTEPERFQTRFAAHAGSPDREILLANRSVFSRNLRESFRKGEAGPLLDALLLARPWEIPLSDIARPVFLWHGEKDRIVPPEVGTRLSGEIPGCRSFFLPEEGHFSLPVRRIREILSILAGDPQEDAGG